MVNAPWDDDMVMRLNARQECGFLHPYTCGNCRADLRATTRGWVCLDPACEYTQNWASEPPTIDMLEQMNPAKLWK